MISFNVQDGSNIIPVSVNNSTNTENINTAEICLEVKSVTHAKNGKAITCEIAIAVMILPTYCLKLQ